MGRNEEQKWRGQQEGLNNFTSLQQRVPNSKDKETNYVKLKCLKICSMHELPAEETTLVD